MSLRYAIVSSLMVSSLLALPASAAEPAKLDQAALAKTIDTEVVSVLKQRASGRSNKMSRVAVDMPDAHRVRFTSAAQTDAAGKTFFVYVVEAGYKQWVFDEKVDGMKAKTELEWTQREQGCAYDDGRVFVKRHESFAPASSLKASKKKPPSAPATTCVAADPSVG